MSFFRKSSGNEAKSATLGSVSRQNVIQDTNKRRSLLQDNSWIKNRPTEEENKSKDENFGKNILSHYKSQDNLDRPAEDEGTNRIHNRFKSDDALDRIPLKGASERGNKAATLERLPASDKSEYENKRQSWTPGSRTTATTTSTEDKRKSWTPLNKSTITTTETKHINQPTDKSTTASWIDSAKTSSEKPKVVPRSPTANTDNRNQNIEHIEVSNTKIKSTKGTDELDNFIDIKPSTIKEKPRTDELDKLIDIKPSATKAKPRTDELDKLIDIKPSATKAKPRTDELDNLIDIKPSAIKAKPRTDDLNNLIDIKPSAVKGKTRTDDLNNLIDIKPSAVKGKTSSNTILKEEDLDDFIQVERDAKNIRSRDQGLDDLIAITGDTNKGTVKPTSTNTSNVTSRSSTTSSYVFNEDNQSAPSRNSTTTYTVTEDTHNVPNRRSTTTTRVTESTDAGSRRSASYNVSDNSDAPNQRSNVGYSQETSYSSPPTNTYVYKTSFEDSRSYQSNSAANSIKTVYSTSDRSVIEKDMCTFCRKILGIDAKMILKDLSISCHASCFKCEVCNGDLGGMRAGDSMWIYKQAIHCEPCYFAAREKWII
ncbi:sciellin isoform X4 [Xenopus laevis]|uniref:Sciellin isoform X4 n=1 Tax=Xenopus laevis TaxID=8355 RepID=A0A8J1MFR9_XENLA|nr:sciellin isoform X4 [Xenopus laevis]